MNYILKWLSLLPMIAVATIGIGFVFMFLTCFVAGLEYAILGTSYWNEYTSGNWRLGVQGFYLSMLLATILVYWADYKFKCFDDPT